MADFRKLILVLAVLAIVAAPASAQLACTELNAVPTQLRSEGVTELVGNTELVCSNGAAQTVSITAVLGPSTTVVTNKILSTGKINAYVRVPAIDGSAEQFIAGTLLPDGRTVVWDSIELPATATGTALVTITNVRVNASGIAPGSDVTERLFVSGTSVLPLPSNTVVVGGVFRGLFFSATSADTGFAACTGHNVPLSGATPDFTVTFTEGFADAFKIAGPATATISGESNPLPIPDNAVTNPTQLRAVFENVPAGVAVYVSISPVNTGTPGPPTTDIASGATTPSGTPAGFAKVTLTDGKGTVIWNITGNALNAAQSAEFDVIVSVPAGTIVPVTGASTATTVYGTLAPLSTVATASTTAPIPRFVEQNVERTSVFTVNACVTNLLFPFVSNSAGFDTGIAIINTSLDNATGSTGTPPNQPFNTTPQSGTCTLYYFGANTSGAPVAPQTTASVDAGTFVSFAVSQGGPAGATGSAAGFTGYIIARCNFQFAHGFAFITDLGAQKLAMGYLAMVIPDRSGARLAQPFTFGTGTGEQLAF